MKSKSLKMNRIAVITLLFSVFINSINAQSKKEQDQEAIKKMCGCYEVSFNFAETFQYAKDSTYKPSKIKHDKGLEWVELVSDGENKLVMQHLLIVGPPKKQKVIKHWRQDWLYENTDFYIYDHNNKWLHVKKTDDEVKGQWTQKVFQVDDSPRYEGSASWVHVDGKSYWENRTDAPLPRREYTKRDDYNVTVRGNRHEITAEGWVHDQNNDKIIRKVGNEDVLLAQEKGVNVYKKVEESRCKTAIEWWKENQTSWALVRDKWQHVFNNSTNLELHSKVADKPLYGYLFSKDFIFNKENVAKTIDAFIKNNSSK